MEKILAAVLLVLGLWTGSTVCQTTVHKLAFRSDIQFRFATTEVTCVMSNDGSTAQELLFDVTLPKQAFISNFSMMIQGKVYPGNVKEKQQARRDYADALAHGHTGGLVEQKPRHSNQFEVAVNVAAGHNVTFTLIYQELLRRRFGTYEHAIHIDSKMAVKELSVEVFIQERAEIENVRTPAMRKDVISNAVNESVNTLTDITMPTPSTAYIKYRSTQEEMEKAGGGWFVVQYDVASDSAGEILVVDGYFVHYFLPPNDLPPLPLDIVFVLDISGSMSGEPIRQLREAMRIILGDLRPTDRFNVLLFDDAVETWSEDLQEASISNVQRAQGYVSGIDARGSTNIHMALTRGVDMLQRQRDRYRVPMLFFLTDGEPTTGIQDPKIIVEQVTDRNKGVDSQRMANIYSLAFGSGADYRLLKQVSAKNNGFARRIYSGADATLQVSGLYTEIATVVLRGLTIAYHSSTSDQGRREGEEDVRVDNGTVTVCTFPTLFAKSDAVVAGKIENFNLLRVSGEGTGLQLVVTGHGSGGNEINLVLDKSDVTDLTLTGAGDNPYWAVPRDLANITERAWAFLTIQQLLEQKVAAEDSKQLTAELDGKILQLSLKYHFVTPLTSMVVTRPEDDVNKDKKTKTTFDDDEIGRDPPRAQSSMIQSQQMSRRMYSHIPLPAMQHSHSYLFGGDGAASSGPLPQLSVPSPVRGAWKQNTASKTHGPSDGQDLLDPYPDPYAEKYSSDDLQPAARRPHLPTDVAANIPVAPTTATRTYHKAAGKGPKGKRTKVKQDICLPNKKVILESVSARGVNFPESCAQLKGDRSPMNFTLLEYQFGDIAFTLTLTSKLVKDLKLRQGAEVVSFSVTEKGHIAHNSANPMRQSLRVGFHGDRVVTANTTAFDVIISVVKERCHATHIRIEVDLGNTQSVGLSGFTGVVVDMLQENATAAGLLSGKPKKGKRGRRQRRKINVGKGKAKAAKFCVARGIPLSRSTSLSYGQLKRHLA